MRVSADNFYGTFQAKQRVISKSNHRNGVKQMPLDNISSTAVENKKLNHLEFLTVVVSLLIRCNVSVLGPAIHHNLRCCLHLLY